MSPRQNLNLPPLSVYELQRRVESLSALVAGTVSSEEHDNAGVTIVNEGVLQHFELQQPIRDLLLSTSRFTSVKQTNLNSTGFQPVPYPPHFRRD